MVISTNIWNIKFDLQTILNILTGIFIVLLTIYLGFLINSNKNKKILI